MNLFYIFRKFAILKNYHYVNVWITTISNSTIVKQKEQKKKGGVLLWVPCPVEVNPLALIQPR